MGIKDMAIGTKVKGITIEFNGDTTKLGKAISDINKKTKDLDDQLKQVDRALKFNPKNTELLAQKQQLLGQKVEATKDKLTALKDAQAKLDDDPAVAKTSQDYMELRREIIETESKLEHFEKELKDLNNIKFKQLGDQVQQVGDKMKAVGEGMTKYVTGPIIAAAGASVAAFKEVDAGLDIVTQKTGATGEALDAMKDSAKNLATEIPTDFETAGAAIGEVNTRFGITGQELENLSGQFIKFAQLNDMDVSTAIDQTQKALAAFGMDASDAGTLMDQLNKVGQNTGASMDSLLTGLVQNGTAFQEMGLSAEQAATLMGQMETSGANSETVMQGLRKALKNATEQGIPLDQALSDLQNTILNGTDGMDGLTAAYDLFGKSGDQIYGAVKNGTIDFSNLGVAAEDAKGSVDKTFEETLDPADRFTMAMNRMKVTGYEIGSTLLDILNPAIEKLSKFFEAVSEKWNSLSPGMKDAITKFALIAAAVGPVLVVIGGLITKIGMLITFLPAIAGALPALGAAFTALAGPIGIVIGVIAALIAIGVLLYKNWDKVKEAAATVRDAVVNAFTQLKDTLTGVFKAIGTALVAPFKKAWEFIKAVVEKIKAVFKFKVSLPHIKLPHFSVQPKGWQLGDLLKGKIPTLGIDWYAQGGIFNSPSVIGVGEAGPEAVLPIDRLQDMLTAMADNIVNGMMAVMQLQAAGYGGEIKIVNYLYPNGPKMGEETVRMYDKYKRILG